MQNKINTYPTKPCIQNMVALFHPLNFTNVWPQRKTKALATSKIKHLCCEKPSICGIAKKKKNKNQEQTAEEL